MRKLIFVLVCLLVLLVNNTSSQYSDNRAQAISNIFQIPIQTLTAISNFAQNTRPLVEAIQKIRYPQYIAMAPLPPQLQGVPVISYPRSRAAKIAGLYTAPDGSGFRI